MAKKKVKTKEKLKDIIGAIFDDLICDTYIPIGDAILILDNLENQKVFLKKSILKTPKPYLINDQPIIDVSYSNDKSLFIFKTKSKTYFRNKANQDIQGSEDWKDYYLEPYTSSFFRKDDRGRWYDVQGYLLKTPFIIKDQILISLNGKKSRKSLFYRDQKLFINPKSTMVQAGKIVYDIDLNVIHYFGEKITGLGRTNVYFNSEESIQEVQLGLTKSAFIDELNYEPILLNGEEIINHISSKKIENLQFEIFQSEENEYIVWNSLSNILQYNNEPLKVDFNTFMEIGPHKVIKAQNQSYQFYFDLNSNLPFDPLQNKNLVVDIDQNPVKMGSSILYNLSCEKSSFVYDATRESAFAIDNETIHPESITIAEHFEQYFFYAQIEGINKLCSQITKAIVKIEDYEIAIKKILSEPNQKLLNFITTNDEQFVLDTRFGFENLRLAKIGPYRIVEAKENASILGDYILQNVLVQTLGGTKERVVNLNEETLEMFRLPKDLKSYSEQPESSIFAGNIISKIDFNHKIEIEKEVFYNATIIDYLNEPKNIILQQKNARPLQLDGVGHRNEIVQYFDKSTLNNKYFLSKHRIIAVNSLTEDLKESQLLFSFNTMSSWLPFYDTYLPIFKRIKDFNDPNQWEYHLFELHNISKEKEYVAVEQNPPYRILVDKSKSKYKPRIVKSKEIILKSPEEISAIRRFFSNPGYLVEVG